MKVDKNHDIIETWKFDQWLIETEYKVDSSKPGDYIH